MYTIKYIKNPSQYTVVNQRGIIQSSWATYKAAEDVAKNLNKYLKKLSTSALKGKK